MRSLDKIASCRIPEVPVEKPDVLKLRIRPIAVNKTNTGTLVPKLYTFIRLTFTARQLAFRFTRRRFTKGKRILHSTA